MLKTGIYKGLACYTLENDWLQVTVLPELGAKIASIRYKPQQFEVLFQPADGCFRKAFYGAAFAAFDTAGADEMYPTIDACSYPYASYGQRYLPDHGELWSIPWQVWAQDDCLVSEVQGIALPYRLQRRLQLRAATLELSYRLENLGTAPLYGLWAFHGLAACDAQTEIRLPGVSKVMNVHSSSLLGAIGQTHSFPVTQDGQGAAIRLDRIAPATAKKTEKWYVAEPLAKGEAMLTLNQNRLLYRLEFPAATVPYLGVWINEGGFKGEYNCALEPATGFYDSLEIANARQGLEPLPAGGQQEWTLTLALDSLANE